MTASVPSGGAVQEALRRKDFPLAERLLGEVVTARPGDGTAWRDLALIYRATRRLPEAIRAFEAALQAGLSEKLVSFDYACTLSDAGDNAGAERVLRAALARRPRDFALCNVLGVVLKRAGRLREAVAALEQARKLEPKNVSPWINLGNTWMLLDEAGKARDAFARVVRLEPKRAENWRLLGRAQARCGDGIEARKSFERALLLNPRDVSATCDLLQAMIEAGDLEGALARVQRARQADPADSRLTVNEARILRRLGRLDESRALLDEVLARNPDDEHALLAIARLIEGQDRQAANGYLRRAVAAKPDSLELLGALCDSLNRSRYGDEAEHIQAAYDIAVSLADRFGAAARGEAKNIRSLFLRCVDVERLDCVGTLNELAPSWVEAGMIAPLHFELGRVRTPEDRLRVIDWHRTWGRKVQARIKPLPPVEAPAIVGGAKIRVGFMSSDLRAHPVTYFALPLLESYDRDRFEVYCYSFYERAKDDVQALIESKVDAFRWWPRRPDREVAEGIAADRLHILFELGGSTDMNKLEVMAYRPAPLGASWLGYPHSAGLETIDYILVDPFIKPEDPRLLIEKPFEVSETWVALGRLGFVEHPIIGTIPEERKGHLTFGTMNNPYKYTPQCLDAWARILQAVPGSRFLFVRPEGGVPSFRANVERQFEQRGVAPSRIAYVAVRGKHMPHYNEIDIALDTFPHVGGTTTCETLWMGVPVVTLVGPAFFERLSYSNLSNAGLGDLCAFDVESYVAKAVTLADDAPRRRALRRGLRQQIREHPLGQPDRFTRAFYDSVARVVGG